MTEQVVSRSSEMSHQRRVPLASILPSRSRVRASLWMIGPPLLLALLGVLLATHVQKPSSRATAEVYVNSSPFAGVGGAFDPRLLSSSEGVDLFMTRQAGLARSRELAGRVVAAAGVPGMSAAQFLRNSSAKRQAGAEILNLSVVYPKPAVAVQLANAYAMQFARYTTELDVAQIEKALSALKAQIKALRAQGATGSPAFDEAVASRAQLQTTYVLAHRTSIEQAAEHASSFRPHAQRNGIVGGVLGALLGIALVAVIKIWPNRRSQNL